ncbi:hypothetical protein Ddye_025328 [Dipteronia dyeriana]|uniref:Uncharacterized protein n=1 Tax=Dipteronia dyeriana TaxID=168575 RepID=A0AAD9TWJ3_9ROSI|nr:hypothetical protein Ddye_025328 [Dipteronia dyeriana]
MESWAGNERSLNPRNGKAVEEKPKVVVIMGPTGVPHHLLGTVSPTVEFTSKDFRDSAIPIINEILSRNHIPVIVGGTNYYIQALVSPFLLDDSAEDMDESCPSDLLGDEQTDLEPDFGSDGAYSYENLKDLDPVAAKRIHPNNHRKISQYLSLYARSGVLPSKLYQGKAAEGRTGVVWTILDSIAALYVPMQLPQCWTNTWNKE